MDRAVEVSERRLGRHPPMRLEDAIAYALEKPRAEARTTVPPSRTG
jgi:hypothetical protein